MDDPPTEFCVLPTISWVRLEGRGLTGKEPCRYPVPSITASDLLFPPCTHKSLFCSYNPRAGPLGRLGRTEAEPLALTMLLSERAEAALSFSVSLQGADMEEPEPERKDWVRCYTTAAGFKCGWHTLLTMHKIARGRWGQTKKPVVTFVTWTSKANATFFHIVWRDWSDVLYLNYNCD